MNKKINYLVKRLKSIHLIVLLFTIALIAVPVYAISSVTLEAGRVVVRESGLVQWGYGSVPWIKGTQNELQIGIGAKHFEIDRQGNISIGGAQQTEKLNVAGDILVSSGSDVCIDGGNCLSGASTNSSGVQGIDKVMVFEGDSLTSAQAGPSWPSKLSSMDPFFLDMEFYNYGFGGDVILPSAYHPGMLADYYAEGEQHKKILDSEDAYYFIYAGTNDIAQSKSAVEMYQEIKKVWSAAREDGFKVVAFTVHPLSLSHPGIDQTKEAERIAFNDLVSSDPSLYDYLVRPDVLFDDPNDLTYYNSDGIHFNNGGREKLAEEVANVVAFQSYKNIVTDSSRYDEDIQFKDVDQKIYQNNPSHFIQPMTSDGDINLSSVGDVTINLDSDDNNNTTEGHGFYIHKNATDESGDSLFTIRESGNVGVGVSNPTATIDVDGNIKIGDELLDCSAATEGQVRYDSTTRKHQGCDGTNWNNLY